MGPYLRSLWYIGRITAARAPGATLVSVSDHQHKKRCHAWKWVLRAGLDQKAD